MTRGRPIESQIRQNIIEILYFMKTGYGYEISKAYMQIFPRVTRRSIYYHLKKGLQTEEFKVGEIRKEHGNYSWGGEVEKVYYTLGEVAKPKIDERVKKFFEKNKR